MEPPFREKLSGERSVPLGDGPADLVRRILLDEVKALHRDLLLIWPGPAELPLLPNENGPWLCVHEELGQLALGDPLTVLGDNLMHVRRLAIDWTYLNAIRYLIWFYSIPGGPIETGKVLEATEPYVGVPPNERFSVSGGGHLIQQLLQEAQSLVCETSNLAEALADAVMAADVHLTAETVNSGGELQSRIRLWAPQDGAIKNLKLTRGGRFADGSARFDSRSETAEQILDVNNVFRGKVEWSFRTIVNAPVILGGVRQYEFTLPLMPGWEPEANLDNVDPADRAAAKDVVIPQNLIPLLDEDPNNFDWYRKYHRSGNDFVDHKNVARKWVLNEAGAYNAATYNRNAPFDNYQVFDWSTVADDSVAVPGEWARRTRRLLSSVTRAFLGVR